jgi:hypothetical protein
MGHRGMIHLPVFQQSTQMRCFLRSFAETFQLRFYEIFWLPSPSFGLKFEFSWNSVKMFFRAYYLWSIVPASTVAKDQETVYSKVC